MKTVILLDASIENTVDLASFVEDVETYMTVVSAEGLTDEEEYANITAYIDHFKQSPLKVIVIRFSGRTDIIKALGDEYSIMIIPISFNKESKFYLENAKFVVKEILFKTKGE